MKYVKTLLSVLALIWLTGCSALSPYSTLTKLDLTLSASDGLNPDLNGRPSPIVLRLFELKHPVAFEQADFFSVYERAMDILKRDLVAIEEVELRPGERLALKLSVEAGSRYLGIVAAYRDLPQAQWRHLIVLTAGGITRVQLNLDQDGIHNAAERLARAGNRG